MSTNPIQPPAAGREPTAAERAATLWVARCDAGLKSAQQIEFEQWLAADSRHPELFEEYDGTWALFDRVRESPQSATADETAVPFPRVAGRMTTGTAFSVSRSVRRRRVRLWVGTTLAAAAALAISYVGWRRPNHFTETAATEIGRLQKMPLPDGSWVELNTDSAVSVAYSPGERRIRLERGEAHFTVAKNPARPFIVMANGVAVRAVGTAFNVRLRAAAIEVLVTEGKVRVDDAAKGDSLLPISGREPPGAGGTGSSGVREVERVLSAGHRVVIASAPAVVAGQERAVVAAVATDEMQRELAWQEQRLEFVSASLADIAAEFNRYNRQKLVMGDERLAAKRFGGAFQANDPERFVRMLRENFPVLVEVREGETILRLAP
ncbi:MAG: FecR family protein [Opitutaceae bacterium]